MRGKGDNGEKGERVGQWVRKRKNREREREGGEEKEIRDRGGDSERYWQGEN